jgi:phage baseplate assembly protein W
MTQVPHFSFPFRFGQAGAALVVEQDTYEDLEQNVRVLLLTELGERLEVPDFGIDDLVFQTSLDEAGLAAQAGEWDDRVDVLAAEDPDRVSAMVRHLLIEVTEKEN